MRFPSERPKGRAAASSLAIAMMMTLGACSALSGGGSDGAASASANPSERANNPAADYPVVLGDPFTIDGVTFTPEDTLNYDAVGYAASDRLGGDAVSGAHRTLPLPSYVEVTSLESGRTILVRLERRGVMYGNSELGLSNGAFAQLGVAPGAPVRIRRVLPPEFERAELRSGNRAAERMATPQSLVNVLKRRLPESGYVPGTPPPVDLAQADVPTIPVPQSDSSYDNLPELPPAAMPQEADAATEVNAIPALPPLDGIAPAAAVAKAPKAAAPASSVNVTRASASGEADYMVQAAAFSSADRARNAAATLDAKISKAGRFYRVRTGPFASRGEAERSLAKVRGAGYSDAKILKK